MNLLETLERLTRWVYYYDNRAEFDKTLHYLESLDFLHSLQLKKGWELSLSTVPKTVSEKYSFLGGTYELFLENLEATTQNCEAEEIKRTMGFGYALNGLLAKQISHLIIGATLPVAQIFFKKIKQSEEFHAGEVESEEQKFYDFVNYLDSQLDQTEKIVRLMLPTSTDEVYGLMQLMLHYLVNRPYKYQWNSEEFLHMLKKGQLDFDTVAFKELHRNATKIDFKDYHSTDAQELRTMIFLGFMLMDNPNIELDKRILIPEENVLQFIRTLKEEQKDKEIDKVLNGFLFSDYFQEDRWNNQIDLMEDSSRLTQRTQKLLAQWFEDYLTPLRERILVKYEANQENPFNPKKSNTSLKS